MQDKLAQIEQLQQNLIQLEESKEQEISEKLQQIDQLQQDLATAEQTKEQEITNILDAIELALREEI